MSPINRMLILGAGVVAVASLLEASAHVENTPEDIAFAAKELGLENAEGHRELGAFCDRVFDLVYPRIPSEFLPFDFDCNCDINLRDRAINFGCEMIDHFCPGGGSICVIGEAMASVSFAQDIWAEFDINVDANGTIPVFGEVPDFIAKLKTCQSDGLENIENVATLCSCAINMADTDCTSCEICGESSLGVALDCSNVNADLNLTDICLGVDTLLA